MKEKYLAGHKASGLKKGDKVKVIKKATDFQDGWDLPWFQDMNGNVGKVLEISADLGYCGFQMKEAWAYPYFVLEKI